MSFHFHLTTPVDDGDDENSILASSEFETLADALAGIEDSPKKDPKQLGVRVLSRLDAAEAGAFSNPPTQGQGLLLEGARNLSDPPTRQKELNALGSAATSGFKFHLPESESSSLAEKGGRLSVPSNVLDGQTQHSDEDTPFFLERFKKTSCSSEKRQSSSRETALKAFVQAVDEGKKGDKYFCFC